MTKIIVANWKMNPKTADAARSLSVFYRRLGRYKRRALVIAAPPSIYFPYFTDRKFPLAAQNAFYKDSGAFTGEVSPGMLKSLGIKYVILGHSERREYAGETDEIINAKVKAALKSGLIALLCVGEKSREDENFQVHVRDQLRKCLNGVAKNFAGKLVIAYEPVWAIGTGTSVKPEDLFEMTTYIRRALFDLFGKNSAHKIPVLYGGSVDAKNAKSFLMVDGVSGLLVGGASLHPDEFRKIVLSAT